jgi:mRNA-degrading endonuclease RelE of RelBE toxin-antitoxin system
MEFIEAPAFTKYIDDYLSDDEYAGLQSYLVLYPEAGKKVPGSGGIRKLRWDMPGHGKGKSGGCRIIYFYKVSNSEIWLLTIYGKSDKATIPGHILRKIAQEFEDAH